jgi:hypothetical protein
MTTLLANGIYLVPQISSSSPIATSEAPEQAEYRTTGRNHRGVEGSGTAVTMRPRSFPCVSRGRSCFHRPAESVLADTFGRRRCDREVGDLFDLWEKIIWYGVSWTTGGRICPPGLALLGTLCSLAGALWLLIMISFYDFLYLQHTTDAGDALEC